MKYITISYFEEARPDTFGRFSTPIIELTITEAQAQVDLYIGKYLPLQEVPASLKSIMVDIVEYRLSQDEATDITKERYANALDMLDRISRSGFPEFRDIGNNDASNRVFGNDYVSGINRSGW